MLTDWPVEGAAPTLPGAWSGSLWGSGVSSRQSAGSEGSIKLS